MLTLLYMIFYGSILVTAVYVFLIVLGGIVNRKK